MREASWTDGDGRHHAVLLPDDVADSEAPKGIPLGPPPMTDLGLPAAVEIELHNQLFHRRIFTAADAARRTEEVRTCVMRAFRVSVHSVVAAFSPSDVDTG